ncbi:MAG: hypothetical protein H6662_01105 [Ardenticatenaceae bacterium]|nr:hypothetical protein [Anaerolineales bacterium]MCB8920153.1 hypothetical protein [Ardenticatenaceae bacterium]MCB9005052.1 hypothetical protein [Ardenticatenaceae bacterium]
MAKFDWRTDEDAPWEEEIRAERPLPTPRRRYGLLIIPLLIMVIAGGIYLLVHRVDQQVTAATQNVSSDVLAVHQLLAEAAQAEDTELFAAQLDSQDSLWFDTAQSLLEQNLFHNRASFWLWVDPSQTAESPTVTLSPDLTEATVTERLPYLTKTASNETETIWLEQTAHYVLDNDHWLLTALPDDETFWGKWRTVEGRYVTITYSERDSAIGAQLAIDLDAYVAQLCAETAVPCRPNLEFRLRLSREFTNLLILAQSYRQINTVSMSLPSVYRMDLPTPTLLGWPSDDASYQALLRGYASWVTAVLTDRLTRGNDTVPDRFILDQLVQIGLELPPAPNFNLLPQEPPPIPLPNQDLLVSCKANGASDLWVYQLDSNIWLDAQNVMGQLDPFLNITLAWPLPSDEGVLLFLRRVVNGDYHSQVVLWANGTETILADTAESFEVAAWLAPRMSRNGRYLLLYQLIFNEDDTADSDVEQRFWLLDLQACIAGECVLQETDGVPFWSPDERHNLVVSIGPWPVNLRLNDSSGTEIGVIGKGWDPFWLDDTRFGYVRTAAQAEEFQAGNPVEIVLTDVTRVEDEPTILLTTADFTALELGPMSRVTAVDQRIFVNDILPVPGRDELIISLVTWSAEPVTNTSIAQYFYAYDIATDSLTPLFPTTDTTTYPLSFAQDGRFLTVFTAGNSNWHLNLYDMQTANMLQYNITPTQEYPLPGLDWSADEAWLVIADERMLRLIAPAHDYEYTIFHNYTGCRSANWISN